MPVPSSTSATILLSVSSEGELQKISHRNDMKAVGASAAPCDLTLIVVNDHEGSRVREGTLDQGN
jgi:hypothetical protein